MDPVLPAAGGDRRYAIAAGGGVVIALAGATVGTLFHRASGTDVVSEVALTLVIAVVAVAGAVVALTVPANRVGWLLLAGAAALGAAEALVGAGEYGVLTKPGSVVGAAYFAAIGPTLRAVGTVVTVVVLPLIFPDGHLPGRRWRWLGWCAAVAVAFLAVGNLIAPHTQDTRLAHWKSPLGLPVREAGIADGLSSIAVMLSAVTAGGAVAGLVSRWRRGGPLVRQQLLLFAIAVCVPVVVLVAVLVTSLPSWAFAVGLLPVPVAIGVATVSHGLYDLRRAANRTLIWVFISGGVAAIYAIVVSAVAGLAPNHRQWWPSALAAAIAALTLIPLHESLQRAANRLVYGRWHEPYELLAELGERLEAAADVDRLVEATVVELSTGLGLRDVAVRTAAQTTIADAKADATTTIPLQAYGRIVGWLSYQPPDHHLSDAEQRLVRDLARHLGGALHARTLLDDLQRARERLVLAREEERRRLRRDLHDGIGPALAGLTLKSETAQALLPAGAGEAAKQLQNLSEEIRRMVVDVRQIVEGLRPPALDELGLVAACTQTLERLAAHADVAVALDADELPLLPAAVEVAAYRIVVEAVTNVVRHAGASRCQVRLMSVPGALLVQISDDGLGLGARPSDGHGLAIMQERAEEISGSMKLISTSPGVTVEATLPIANTSVRPEPFPATDP